MQRTRQSFMQRHEKNIELERAAGIEKQYSKIQIVSDRVMSRKSSGDQMKSSSSVPQLSCQDSQLAKTQTKFSEENNATFRVQTASAVNITKSINRMRVSQRLFEIQNAQK